MAVLLRLDVAGQSPLKSPEVTELDLFVDNALGAVLPGQPVRRLPALEDLLVAHEPGALGYLQIVAADLGENILVGH